MFFKYYAVKKVAWPSQLNRLSSLVYKPAAQPKHDGPSGGLAPRRSEDHRRIKPHQRHETVQRCVHPRRPALVAPLGQVPPSGVRQPSQGEGVIQVKSEAGVEASGFRGLRGRGCQRLGMAPAVLEVEGAAQVGEECHQAKRPPAAGVWPGTMRSLSATCQREGISREGQKSRQPNRPIATAHTAGE